MRYIIGMLLFVGAAWSSIEGAYELLLNNKIEEARGEFQKETESFFDKNKAQGYLGLSLVEEWYGNENLQVEHCLKATELHLSPSTLEPCTQILYVQARGLSSPYKEKLLKLSALVEQKWPGESFASNLIHEVQNYAIAEGAVEKVKAQSDQLALIREWKMVGPFNNYSNSAFFSEMEVEKGFDYSETYDGENGLDVSWRDFHHKSLEAWTFLNYYQNVSNSANYFATTVVSEKPREAIVSFGVSGAFSVWLNGRSILHSTVFRNSGMDEFQVRVKLNKGPNNLLLKLGHSGESISNFTLRFLDANKKPLKLKQSYQPHKSVAKAQINLNLLKNEFEARLFKDIKKKKLAAFVQLINRLLLKEDFENALEVCLKLKKIFPKSAWLNLAISEIYTRRGDTTLSQLYIDKSIQLAPNSYRGWRFQLSRVLEEGNPQKSLKFFEAKPEQILMNSDLHLELLRIYYSLNAENAVLSLIAEMEDLYVTNNTIASMLYDIRIKMNNPQKANLLLQKMKKHFGYYPQTAKFFFNALIREGKMKEAADFLSKAIEGQVSATGYLQSLSEIYFEMNDYESALKVADQIIATNPWVGSAYEMKMKIYEKQKRMDLLEQTFKDFIKLSFYDYKMMNRYQEIKGLKPWASKVREFSIDSLKVEAAKWPERNNDNSMILLNQVSNLVYPSGGYESYERMIVEVYDQKGVDAWKETSLSLNGNYESVKIQKAVVHKSDGQTLAADTKRLEVVFKNLEPGDLIELKWRRRHFYPGKLAKNFESHFYFASRRPTLKYYFETIVPEGTQFQVKQNLNKIQPQKRLIEGFEHTHWEWNKVKGYKPEARTVTADIAWPWIQVSSFPNWKMISEWYGGLTHSKSEITPELKILADSLFKNTQTTEDKIKVVHEFITDKIRYSSVSFRQAGYVPQAALKSLTTRVGDCKDMSVLGKTLLSIAGVNSDLVLVETRDDGSAELLPSLDFNHCILKTPLGYVDFTAPNHKWNVLPKMDQGARALVVNDQPQTQLVWLPKMSSTVEFTQRKSLDTLTVAGDFKRRMKSTRSGNSAAGFRSSLKHKKETDLRRELQKVLRASYSHSELQDYSWSGLESNDSLIRYEYSFESKEAAYMNSKTIAFEMPWPDGISTNHLVRERERKYPLEDWDVSGFFGKTSHDMELVLPKGYKILDLPPQVQETNKFGAYKYSYKIVENKIIAQRELMLYPKNVEPSDYEAYMLFMNKVVKTDNGILILIKE